MTSRYDATFFDLGGTLLAIEDDEVATGGCGRDHGIELARCLRVGDREADRRCAEAAGVGHFVWAEVFFSAVDGGG